MVQVPTPTIVTVLPFNPPVEQTAGVLELKVTALPEAPPVALTVNAASPKALPPRALKVIVCVAFCAVTLSVTCGAALKLPLPALSYLTVQVPVPLVMVKSVPTFEHAPELL